LKNRRLDDCL